MTNSSLMRSAQRASSHDPSWPVSRRHPSLGREGVRASTSRSWTHCREFRIQFCQSEKAIRDCLKSRVLSTPVRPLARSMLLCGGRVGCPGTRPRSRDEFGCVTQARSTWARDRLRGGVLWRSARNAARQTGRARISAGLAGRRSWPGEAAIDARLVVFSTDPPPGSAGRTEHTSPRQCRAQGPCTWPTSWRWHLRHRARRRRVQPA
jgi:hypothetical protein